MSDKGSSIPEGELTEVHEEDETQKGTSEEHNKDETRSEEHNKDETQSEEHNKEETQGGTSEEHNEDETQGETGAEIKEVLPQLTATPEDAKMIFTKLKENGVSKVVLIGETGTGKTWMARKICDYAAVENLPEPIWISLDKKHDDKSLRDTIARQFSLSTSTDDREEEGDEKKKNVKNVKTLNAKMIEKLEAAEEATKIVLLVLDGRLDTTKKDIEVNIVEDILGLKLNGNFKNTLKVLITRREIEDGDRESEKFELKPFSGDEATKLLREEVDEKVPGYSQAFEKVCEAFQKRSRKPAEILMLAGTLNYFAKDNDGKLEPALELAASDLEEFWRYAYDQEPGNSMIDCFWHSWNFLGKRGGVHYNELITSWIMEGCLNHTNQIDKAYLEGHKVLMKLVDYHMMKMQEDNIICLEGVTLEMKNYCRRGYLGNADPGLASVLKDIDGTESDEGISPDEVPEGTTPDKVPEVITPAKVLEGITPADGMMKTLCSDKKEKMISSLLIDGSRLCREIHDTFFGPKLNLNLLAIFYPRLKSPEELSISKPENLLVLILRGSYLLKDATLKKQLRDLTVLEISGAPGWTINLPEKFFEQVSQLRSLDLSGAGITSLPKCFSELIELRRLILKGCSSLTELPKMAKFSKLEIIDLSECTNLKKIQEKSFESLKMLKVINFSHTKIEKLPIVKKLKHLTMLLLEGCAVLTGMRMLKQVTSIKVLDLSGATSIREIMYDCFEGADGLREVDLSETQIQYLHLHTGNNFQKLRLRGCKLLRNLPELRTHTLLEELDLSGCEKLDNLPALSDLQKLKTLNLRGTKLWSKELDDSLRRDIKGLEILQ